MKYIHMKAASTSLSKITVLTEIYSSPHAENVTVKVLRYNMALVQNIFFWPWTCCLIQITFAE